MFYSTMCSNFTTKQDLFTAGNTRFYFQGNRLLLESWRTAGLHFSRVSSSFGKLNFRFFKTLI